VALELFCIVKGFPEATVMGLLARAALELSAFFLPAVLLGRRLCHHCGSVRQLAEDHVSDPAVKSPDRSIEDHSGHWFSILAAVTSLKMENPGPFDRSLKAVEDLIHDKYNYR
jgi:hypothetical protein